MSGDVAVMSSAARQALLTSGLPWPSLCYVSNAQRRAPRRDACPLSLSTWHNRPPSSNFHSPFSPPLGHSSQSCHMPSPQIIPFKTHRKVSEHLTVHPAGWKLTARLRRFFKVFFFSLYAGTGYDQMFFCPLSTPIGLRGTEEELRPGLHSHFTAVTDCSCPKAPVSSGVQERCMLSCTANSASAWNI